MENEKKLKQEMGGGKKTNKKKAQKTLKTL